MNDKSKASLGHAGIALIYLVMMAVRIESPSYGLVIYLTIPILVGIWAAIGVPPVSTFSLLLGIVIWLGVDIFWYLNLFGFLSSYKVTHYISTENFLLIIGFILVPKLIITIISFVITKATYKKRIAS